MKRPNRGFKNRDRRPKSLLFKAPLAAEPARSPLPVAPDLAKATEQSVLTIDCGTFTEADNGTPAGLDAFAFATLAHEDRVMWIELLSLVAKVNRHLAKMEQRRAIRGALDGMKERK